MYEHKFVVGQFVMITYPERPPDKLSAKIRRPYMIATIDKNMVTVQSLQNDKIYTLHVSRLRPWKQAEGVDPSEKAAASDPKEYFVEAVLDHHLIPKGIRQRENKKTLRPNHYRFRVRWLGYASEDDTWEPLPGIQHTNVFENYMQSLSTSPSGLHSIWKGLKKPANASRSG